MTTPSTFLADAKWIEADWAGSPHASANAPLFSRSFTLDRDTPEVVLAWTCLGLGELRLDGRPLHQAVLLPGWTDTHQRLRVLRVELGTLSAGPHQLEALLGDGWDVGHVANLPRQFSTDRPRLLARLCWTGGGIVTDSSWQVRPSAIVSNDLIHGEIHDARLDSPPPLPHPVRIAPIDTPPLFWHQDPPVLRQETFTPRRIGTHKTQHIHDLGQNISGRLRIRVRGPRGASVLLRHAEVLQPDGSLHLDNLRSAKATDIYTLAGHPEEVWEPSFTFHGFRYFSVEISRGPVELLELTGIALYTDMPRTGEFSCSDPLLERLFENIRWGQNGNFLEVPTDCPQRDERLGWTGDAQVFAPTAAFLRDVRPFFRKWLADLRDAQRANGLVPCCAPDVRAFGLEGEGGPAWADAIVLIPWHLYQAYGETTFLSENYSAMVRYMDYLAREKVLGHIRSHPGKDAWGGFGDWLALDGSGTPNGNTPKDLIGTAFYARNAEILAATATLLGKPDEADRWFSLHADIRAAFQRRFLTPEGLPTGATQTSCVLALHFNLVTDDQRPACVEELVRRIRKDGPKIGTGFVGTPYLLQVLEDNGHLDLAYQLLLRRDFPSWLFPVTQGATTIWERWDGWHPDRGFQTPGMNSFNHYAYGCVGEWMVRSVAGLAPETPGYDVLRFKPRPGGGLHHASASLRTRHGLAAISWRLHNGACNLELTVPQGATAILDLQNHPRELLPAGTHLRRMPSS